MPDVYLGKSATIGSVILTIGAVIPTAVGVDLGCGMMAVKPSLSTEQLPDSLTALRSEIEKRVPHGLVFNRGQRDTGSCGEPSEAIMQVWSLLNDGFTRLCEKYPRFKNTNNIKHLGATQLRQTFHRGVFGRSQCRLGDVPQRFTRGR